MLVVIFITLL